MRWDGANMSLLSAMAICAYALHAGITLTPRRVTGNKKPADLAGRLAYPTSEYKEISRSPC